MCFYIIIMKLSYTTTIVYSTFKHLFVEVFLGFILYLFSLLAIVLAILCKNIITKVYVKYID